MMNKILLLAALLVSFSAANAQEIKRFDPDTIKTIYIDSAVNIRAHRLTAEDFIREVVNDTSFYRAFRMMKKYDFVAENNILTFDKNNKTTGSMYRKIRHSNDKGGHKMQILAQNDKGELKKNNGKYKLTTVEMFDYIFMNAYNSDFVPNNSTGTKVKGIGTSEGIKDKLKTLIFNPGRPVDVPLIGSKTQIFTANMRQYYDYTYYKGKYLDSIPVFWFKVKIKPGVSSWTEDGLMIKELTTIFDARNFSILGRSVDMKLDNMLYEFDVKMNIEMAYFGDEKLPVKISYQGFWDIPLKRAEKASFLVKHTGYKLE